MDATVVLGRQGRLVIPAEIRVALGLSPGDQLHLHVAGGQLVLERPQDAVDGLRALAKDVPRSRSLVDELLAERRRAVSTEPGFTDGRRHERHQAGVLARRRSEGGPVAR